MTGPHIRRRLGENSRAVHLPPPETPTQTPIGLPVWRTSSWRFGSSAEYGEIVGPTIDNPTVAAFAAGVAALEGAAAPEDVAGEAFPSGPAAIATICMTFLRAGSHVVAPAPVSGATYALLRRVMSRFGVRADFVDQSDLRKVRAALRPNTKIIFAETLADPTMVVADIRGLYRIAREAEALLVIDSTLATPVVCRPLEHGADLVVHSATTYISGHDDCAGGVVVGRPALVERLGEVRADTGAALSPEDAFLLHRGLETLPLRVRRMCATASVFAAAVAKHPRVRGVDYPGLVSHSGHELARHLFDSGPEGTRYGACVTVTPYGGYEAGIRLADAVRLARVANSVGGTHTKAAHVASTSHRRLGDDILSAGGVDAGAVRFAIGLEDAEDLIVDVMAALDGIGADGRGPGGAIRPPTHT
ncbi:MAG TPA: PLP-dependent transferase [Thermopolyspora sp.]|jgi:Cystathionine beta-lyases/cystathionine gamma-synthases